MMESSNLDHQHQEEFQGVSSSFPSASFHLVGGNHEWNQNLIVNGGDFIPNVSGVLSGLRDFRLSNEIPAPTLSTHMVQDLGFHWTGNAESFMNHSAHQANLARIKVELSDSFPKLSGVIRDPSTAEDYHLRSTSCIKHEQQGLHELDERLLLRTFPSGCQTNGLQSPSGNLLFDASNLASFGGATACGRGNYSMVLPTANISSLNPPSSSSYPGSLGMDLQALDLLASARFGRSFCEPSFNSMGLFREDNPFGLSHLQEPAQGPSNSHHKVSSLVSGVTEAKRANNVLEHKASQAAPKKPRFETRSSFSPFKVRKEKLGDRIAALQQLVAPFGKTDTASVLMEAIGYIKFLQDQVETLSVPYMRSSKNKKMRTTQGATSEDGDEPKPDLRSRGLCLVPLSCTSYVTNENGGVWSPPTYRGSN